MHRHLLRAFTFFEVVIAATVMMLVVGASLLLLGNTNRSVGDQLAITDTASRANRLAEALRRELRSAGGDITLSGNTVTTSGNYTRITYNKMTGFDWTSGGPEFDESVEPQRQIRFVPTEASATNGIDDDGDGLIDEGRLVLFLDRDDNGTFAANEETGDLALDVAGDSLEFSLQPSGAATRQDDDTHLRITFETFRRLPNDTRIVIHRELVELQLALRNREQS